jgi:serine/threonine protein kinase
MDKRFQIDEKIGEYRVVGFIGQGGMGEVYHFHHEKLNRPVAVKVLGGSVSLDENYKTRFLNEARLQASLQHPNIATLYDFQEVGNELLIFMELVDGESLDSLIDRQFFSVEESLQVFESIVGAIKYVHENGIIHRDIKAENVKLNQQGVPKLLDFGIAKDYQSQTLTQIGGVIGTPNYLAPEQIDGEKADEQTDIWSLGVLLYRMLTGRLPFEAAMFETLVYQIVQAKFETPETYNPAIPKAVSQIVKRCLAKDVQQRYQTAEELLQDVRKVLNERYSGEKLFAANKRAKLFSIAKISIFVVPIFALLVLLGLGIWAISGTSDKPDADQKSVKVETPARPVSTPKKSESPIVQADSDRNKRTVRIDAIGGSAEVWRKGQKIGNTPLDLEVAEKESVSLILKRQGFVDSEVEFEASAGKKVYTFSLSPK